MMRARIIKRLQTGLLRYAPYIEPMTLRHAVVGDRVFVLRKNGEPGYRIDELLRSRAIFFHIPKTGGLSVAEALFGSRAAGHITVDDARLIFGARQFRSFFKFCFVRNPWDRLVSAYHYLSRGHPTSPVTAIAARYPTFQEFVKHALSIPVVAREVHMRPQSSFVTDGEGRLIVDFVGRFEHLEGDFATVAERLSLAGTLARTNQSSHLDYRKYYDRETRELVADFYRLDIDTFRYTFDS